jgi:hypothetical protein
MSITMQTEGLTEREEYFLSKRAGNWMEAGPLWCLFIIWAVDCQYCQRRE